jgi:hypothetical protein
LALSDIYIFYDPLDGRVSNLNLYERDTFRSKRAFGDKRGHQQRVHYFSINFQIQSVSYMLTWSAKSHIRRATCGPRAAGLRSLCKSILIQNVTLKVFWFWDSFKIFQLKMMNEKKLSNLRAEPQMGEKNLSKNKTEAHSCNHLSCLTEFLLVND